MGGRPEKGSGWLNGYVSGLQIPDCGVKTFYSYTNSDRISILIYCFCHCFPKIEDVTLL